MSVSSSWLTYCICIVVMVRLISGIPVSNTYQKDGAGGKMDRVMAPTQSHEVISDQGERIHIQLMKVPERGLTIVGVGKGDDPAEERDASAKSCGFEYCKLGTGNDADWYITDERYVFGPDMNIHFGGHYTYSYEDRWCEDDWYRPDGTIFFEDKYDFHTPHPQDSGYEYWEWYNVVFWYDPIPSGMQNVEGIWTARR